MNVISYVGIFWGIPVGGQDWFLLSDKTPVEQGEIYGDCITHATGHYEFWESLVKPGSTALATHGLPSALIWHEYEDFPRGRIVHWPKSHRFVIYADRRLHTNEFIQRLTLDFGIPDNVYTVRRDPHYVSKQLTR